MAEELCPACGKAHHTGFDCPAGPESRTDPAGGPLEVTTPHSSQPSSAFKGTELAPPSTRLTPGTLVGEYQILDRIGEGGMGTVYSAVHPIIGKKVAIKVLAGRLAKNQNAIQRFVLEARAVNEIGHPALVDIFSFGRLTDGRHYYVMEYLEGRSLGAMLRAHQRLSPQAAHPVFAEVARALVAVHGHGIVHRDLKPDNVILMPMGEDAPPKVKLVDFGLAKLMEADPKQNLIGPHTAVGVNVGTPHYMSPEQCRGGKVDARSDLYALGIMFYETITGRLPFDGPTPVDIWQAHVEKMPVPPREIVPDEVSPALSELVMRLLAKNPEERPQSAAEFCEALEALAANNQLGPSPEPGPGLAVDGNMLDLARALSSTPVCENLISLDVAADARLSRAALSPDVPLVPAMVPKPVPVAQDVAATLRDIPAITDADLVDRFREIDDLRAALGLQIEEPASNESQVSALVINLEATTGPREPVRAATPAPITARPVLLGRRIEERKHLPQLSAPRRSAGAESSSMPKVPSRPARIARVAAMALVIVAAAVIALWLGR